MTDAIDDLTAGPPARAGTYVRYVASHDKPGHVVVQAYVDGVAVLARSVHWRVANNAIPEIHEACREAMELEGMAR